jgi:Effector Associated Constant Component 1
VAEVKLFIRRGFTELPDDKKGQKILVAERKRLFDGLVNALDLEVKNRSEIDNPEPPHEVIEVIVALGSAGVFTAMVSVFKAWLESKKIQMIDLECQRADGEAVKVRMHSATVEEVQTVLRELASCYSTR